MFSENKLKKQTDKNENNCWRSPQNYLKKVDFLPIVTYYNGTNRATINDRSKKKTHEEVERKSRLHVLYGMVANYMVYSRAYCISS